VAWLQRHGSSTAPIVVGGRTVTLRSHTSTLPVHIGGLRLWWVHARPDHVEVLEPDGRHHTLRVHDVTYTTRVAVMIGSLACAALLRRRRRSRRGTAA